MPDYSYICREHDEPHIFDVTRSMKEEIFIHIPCPLPSCKAMASRHYPSEKFSGRVKGGYGGGPITK